MTGGRSASTVRSTDGSPSPARPIDATHLPDCRPASSSTASSAQRRHPGATAGAGGSTRSSRNGRANCRRADGTLCCRCPAQPRRDAVSKSSCPSVFRRRVGKLLFAPATIRDIPATRAAAEISNVFHSQEWRLAPSAASLVLSQQWPRWPLARTIAVIGLEPTNIRPPFRRWTSSR